MVFLSFDCISHNLVFMTAEIQGKGLENITQLPTNNSLATLEMITANLKALKDHFGQHLQFLPMNEGETIGVLEANNSHRTPLKIVGTLSADYLRSVSAKASLRK
jgi:hypothetical protein